jgi:hypothetical protein
MASQSTRTKHSFRSRTLWVAALLSWLPISIHAQTAVTNWTLSNTNGADTSGYSPAVNFDNQINTISTITVGTAVKYVSANADAAYVRRSAIAGNNANVWEVASSANNLTASNTSASTLQNVLLSGNTLMGVNDLFTNVDGAPAAIANNNIERVDYYFNGGFKSLSDQGFAIFDRAASQAVADGFQIAVITGWNTSTSQATDYSGNLVKVTAGASSGYGAALDYDPTTAGSQSTFTYQIMRFQGNGDSLSTLTQSDATSTQSIFGVFISFADLGIANGTTVYGYSIMANDVIIDPPGPGGANIDNLVNWNNATYFPQTTSDTTGSIDLLGVNGRRWIPEPSTYGAIFLGIGSAFAGLRRWRRNLRPA